MTLVQVIVITLTSLKHSHSLKNFKNPLKERRHNNFINDLNFLKETCMVSHMFCNFYSHKNQDCKDLQFCYFEKNFIIVHLDSFS